MFKKIALVVCGLFLCIGASFALFGCSDNREYNQLYVFCSKGGYVTVEGQDGVVKNGDEGSRIFKIPAQESVKLSAVAEDGYVFDEWVYAEALNEKYETLSHKTEINLISDCEIMVVKAEFLVAGDTFKFNYSNGNGYQVKLLTGYQTSIQKGGEVKFSVELDTAYSKSNVVVKNNGEVLTAQKGVYTISNVQNTINITVENVTQNKYSVTIPTGDGYTIGVVAGYDASNVLHGNSFKFYLNADTGYTADDFVVSVNGKVLTPSGNIYTISNIVNDCAIQVSKDLVTTYTISVVDVEGVTIIPVDSKFTVSAGENFKFTISASTGVDISSISVFYYRGDTQTGTSLTHVSGVYTIENVDADIKIQVTGVNYVNQKTITAIDSRFTIEPVNTTQCLVDYGADFVFKIKLKDGYQASNMVVKANGTTLTEENGQYTIKNVIENQIISVDGISIKTYSVTMPTGSGYTITKTDGSSFTSSDLSSVAYGTKFGFKVTIWDSYTNSCIVKAGSSTLTANEGVYTFIVVGNTQITISGLQVKQFTINVPSVDGVKITTTDGSEITVDQQVTYGGQFKFKITITDSTIKSCEVKVNGDTITASSGVYTISNVTANKQITIVVAKDNSYTVTTTNPLRGANFVLDTTTGNLGENFNFAVNVDNNYTFSNISIHANAGTIAKSKSVNNGNGTTTINFVLNYTATGNYEKTINLKIENVFFKYSFKIDYDKVAIGEGQINALPNTLYYELDVNEELRSIYALDDFKMYSLFGTEEVSTLTLKEVLQTIQSALSADGYTAVIGNDLLIGEDVFISVAIDDIIDVDWTLVSDITTEYYITVTKVEDVA